MSAPIVEACRTAAGTVEVTVCTGKTAVYSGTCDPDSEADRVRIVGEVLGLVPGLDPEELDRAILSCCRPNQGPIPCRGRSVAADPMVGRRTVASQFTFDAGPASQKSRQDGSGLRLGHGVGNRIDLVWSSSSSWRRVDRLWRGAWWHRPTLACLAHVGWRCSAAAPRRGRRPLAAAVSAVRNRRTSADRRRVRHSPRGAAGDGRHRHVGRSLGGVRGQDGARRPMPGVLAHDHRQRPQRAVAAPREEAQRRPSCGLW